MFSIIFIKSILFASHKSDSGSKLAYVGPIIH